LPAQLGHEPAITRQTVGAGRDDDVDTLAIDVFEQTVQPGAVGRRARDAVIGKDCGDVRTDAAGEFVTAGLLTLELLGGAGLASGRTQVRDGGEG
jgi:hypothetical protein